jgi:hypothetical protein
MPAAPASPIRSEPCRNAAAAMKRKPTTSAVRARRLSPALSLRMITSATLETEARKSTNSAANSSCGDALSYPPPRWSGTLSRIGRFVPFLEGIRGFHEG